MESLLLLLHCLAPIVVFAFYTFTSFICLAISVRKTTLPDPPKGAVGAVQPGRRHAAVILSLALLVFITYLVEAGLLISIKTSQQPTTVPDEFLLSTLYRTLVWFILILGLDSTATTPPSQCSFTAACAVDWLFNAIIFGTAFIHQNAPQGSRIVQLIMQSSRLGLEAILFLFPLVRLCINRDPATTATDEEAAPLLAAASNSASQITSYGGAAVSQDAPSASDSQPGQAESLDDEDDEQEVPQMTKHWWIYVKSFVLFLPYLWPSDNLEIRFYYLGIGLCLIVTRFLKVLIPLQLGMIVNALADDEMGVPWKQITSYIMLQVLVSSGGVDLAQDFLWLAIEKYSLSKISCASYDHIMGLSYDFHSNKKSGSMWQVMHRGESVVSLLRNLAFDMGPTFVDLVVAIVVFYWLFDAYMAFIGAVAVVMVVYTTHKTIRKKKEGWRQFIKLYEVAYEQMTESTLNWTTVSYFNRIKHEMTRFHQTVMAEKTGYISYRLLSSTLSSLRSLILLMGLFVAMLLAAAQITSGTRQVGDFVALLTYWTQLSIPLAYFAVGFSQIVENLIDSEKLLDLMKKNPTVQDKPDAKEFQLRKGEVSFKDVKFSYDGKRDVLQGINFDVNAGQTVALVGETGGGKSTILRLLFRFYDVSDGSIKVDGQDLRDVAQESFREHVGVVPQDAVLFNKTILENLQYAKLEASEAECMEACKAVALHDKIMSFPKQYKTICGERGIKMSGGEIQRMAIARVILKAPSVVLLDEATSSVDSETEAIIQSSLVKLTKGKTTFVIAHRLSTIVNADLVLVVKQGVIEERGTHDELLLAKGHYFNLWSHQVKLSAGSENSHSPTSAKARAPIFLNDLDIIRKRFGRGTGDSKNQKKDKRVFEDVTAKHRSDIHKAHDSSHDMRERSKSPAKSGRSKSWSLGRRNPLKPDAPEFVPQSMKLETANIRPSLPSQSETIAKDTPISRSADPSIISAQVGGIKHTDTKGKEPDSKSKSTSALPMVTTIKEPRKRYKKRKNSLSSMLQQVKNPAQRSEVDQSLSNATLSETTNTASEAMQGSKPSAADLSKEDVSESNLSPSKRKRSVFFTRRKDSKSEPPNNKPGGTNSQVDGMTDDSGSANEGEDIDGEKPNHANGDEKKPDPGHQPGQQKKQRQQQHRRASSPARYTSSTPNTQKGRRASGHRGRTGGHGTGSAQQKRQKAVNFGTALDAPPFDGSEDSVALPTGVMAPASTPQMAGSLDDEEEEEED